MDEWKIQVGRCIVKEVEKGLRDADYVVLVLSDHAASSGWVENEWKTKYWDEIQSQRAIVHPNGS